MRLSALRGREANGQGGREGPDGVPGAASRYGRGATGSADLRYLPGRGREFPLRLAQLTGLLDLAETPETALLRERLAAADPVADIVFTAEEEAAYRNLVDRFTAMWSLSSPLARFLY